MGRPEACEGRSVRKDKDATRRLVAKRLAWLAKDSNWDGTLRPPPKLILPPSSGLKSSMACAGRRVIGSISPCVEQAPGWDGRVVTDITRCTTSDEDQRMATTTRKPRHDSPRRDEYNNKGERWASKVVSTQQNDVSVSEMPTVETGKRVAETTAEQTTDTRLPLQPFRGGDWPASHDCKFWYSGGEEEQEEGNEEEGALFVGDEQDQDTAAGDDDSNGAINIYSGSDGGRVSGAAYRATSDGSGTRGSAPKTNDTNDTISELSCSGIFTIPSTSEIGDEQGNQDQGSGSDESTHDSSSESPNQTRVATPRDDDDIDASHVEHLIQERRRWKLRAFESEHELAGFQSLHARTERRIGGRAMEPRSAEVILVQASESFSESVVSETLVVESGFDLNDRWLTASGNDEAPSASSCSTSSAGRARQQRGFLDTASDAQFSGAASATSDCLPASGARRDTSGLRNQHRNRLVDGEDVRGGQGKNGDTQQHIEGTRDDDYHDLFCGDGDQGENGTPTHRLLQEEIAELKENLRKAELRHATAEATATSVLQRARAAELSRDVKEIQIRNLEIRLARYTNNNKQHKEACAHWRERQHFGEDESPDGGINFDLFRPRMEPLLPTVVEEGAELLRSRERIRNDRGRPSSTVENHGPNDAVCDARSRKDAVGGLAVGGRWAALDCFRHSCFVLGAKAARAGGGAMSVAAAVESEAAKEAVHSATAAVGGGGGRDAAGDRFSQSETDGGIVEEYWGSDYCTSV